MIGLIFGLVFGADILKTTEYSPAHEVHVIKEEGQRIQTLHKIERKVVSDKKTKEHPVLKPKVPLEINFKQVKKDGNLPEKVNIYFKFDSYLVEKSERSKLKKIRGKKAILKGMASPEGTDEYNIKLSKKRAEAVKHHLLQNGNRIEKIKEVGERECFEKPINYPKCRKVEIKLND